MSQETESKLDRIIRQLDRIENFLLDIGNEEDDAHDLHVQNCKDPGCPVREYH